MDLDRLRKIKVEWIVDFIVLFFIMVYIAGFFKPSLVFLDTITTGGDTASHYYTAKYLRDTLLPEGRFFGWCPGNYAGFPMLQFYFFFSFWLMVLLGYVVPLTVAFKLVTVLGTFLLPVCAYFGFRFMKLDFPLPSFAAIFTLPFIFMEANSMWGGNVPSMLAGEFSYSLSLALTVLFFGLIYRGVTSKRFWIWNAILLAIVALTHVYTVIFAVCSSIFLLFEPERKELKRRLLYMSKTYLLAFLLVSFWILPLIAQLDYTTPYPLRWIIDNPWKITPPILLPFIGLSVIGFIYCSYRGKIEVGFFYFSILIAVLLFYLSPYLGVVDIRLVPFIQLSWVLTAAYGLHVLTSKLKGKWVIPIIVLLLTTVWVNNVRLLSQETQEIIEGGESITDILNRLESETFPELLKNEYHGFIPSWIQWNYKGFEGKPSWSKFEEINTVLQGDFNDSRVVYEHSDSHNTFGSSRAFESLPLFAGRATLEGLYMQSSISAPFVFYIQSEVSKQNSCPFWMNYPCTQRNIQDGTEHLKMFNVGFFIARSEEVKSELSEHPEYQLEKIVDDYMIYRLLSNENRYVVIPENEPILYKTSDWRMSSYDWFRRMDLIDTPLILVDSFREEDLLFFKQTAENLSEIVKNPVTLNCSITETVGDDGIVFRTSCVNVPHIVKVSYYPNWHVEGAEKIYLVSPSFMLVIPTESEVRIYYADTWIDSLGKFLNILAILFTVYVILVNLSRNQSVRRFLKR